MNPKALRQFDSTPLLRWVGAKHRIADWIINQFPPHEVYVEPYCGGAGVFFRKHRSKLEVLNDLDGELINFFDVLRDRTDELVRAVSLTPWSRKEYERAYEPCDDPLERARRFYVATAQSFAATLVYRSGWRRQRNANQRSPVVDTWRRYDGLRFAAQRLMDAQIDCKPAVDLIQDYDGPQTLFYVDPPYVLSSRSEGKRRRYKHEMDDADHRALAEVLHQVEGMVLLSGYHSALYDELYGDWGQTSKSATTNGNSTSTEVLWLNPQAVAAHLPLFAQREERD